MIVSIKLPSIGYRILLVIGAILLLAGAVLTLRWSLAQSVVEQAENKELAQFAADLSPGNPQTHFTLALFHEKTFLPTDDEIALSRYERAAAVAPHDYRYWLALGKMRERTGNAEGAENALKKAAELAPFYAQIRWVLGNNLLRRGKPDEAFEELRKAAAQNQTFAPYVVDAAMQTFGADNLTEIKQRLGEDATIRAALISSLVSEQKLDAALQIWNQFSTEEKTKLKNEAEILLKSSFDAERFHAALELYAQTANDASEKPVLGKIANGDFESDFISTSANPKPFSWVIAEGAEPQIAFDASNRQSGERSLLLAFKSVSDGDFRGVSQTVAVETNRRYRLEFYARTADLKAIAALRWEVVDASDNRALGVSPAVTTRNGGEWQQYSIDFSTSPRTEAVTARLARVPCSLPPCALVGKIWFDNFNLQQQLDPAVKN